MLIQEFLLSGSADQDHYLQRVPATGGSGRAERPGGGANQITGTIKNAQPNEPKHFSTFRVPPELADKLTAAKLPFSGEPPPGCWSRYLGWILPSLGFLLIWMFMIRPMTGQGGFGGGIGGLMSIGKSKAKVYVETDTKVTFADVAGVDEAKDELREVVEFLKDPTAPQPLGRAHAEGRAAGWAAWDRQDAAGASGCG